MAVGWTDVSLLVRGQCRSLRNSVGSGFLTYRRSNLGGSSVSRESPTDYALGVRRGSLPVREGSPVRVMVSVSSKKEGSGRAGKRVVEDVPDKDCRHRDLVVRVPLDVLRP